MTTLNNLKSMEFHFFETPNHITIFGNDLHTIIIAELEDIIIDSNFLYRCKSV